MVPSALVAGLWPMKFCTYGRSCCSQTFRTRTPRASCQLACVVQFFQPAPPEVIDRKTPAPWKGYVRAVLYCTLSREGVTDSSRPIVSAPGGMNARSGPFATAEMSVAGSVST